MEKINIIINLLLNFLKKILVRFKYSKFGILFIVNLFKLPHFMTDNKVNILSKLKVVASIFIAVFYFVSAIDIIPEILTGPLGLLDDLIVLIWSLGIMSEEVEKYKKSINNTNIIENVKFEIKD